MTVTGSLKRTRSFVAPETVDDVAADEPLVTTPDKKIKVTTPNAPRHPRSEEVRALAMAQRLDEFITWRVDLARFLENMDETPAVTHLREGLAKYVPMDASGFYRAPCEHA